MKRHLLITLFTLTIAICHADPKEEAQALSREAFKMQREMAKLIPNIHDRDPALKSLFEQNVKANQDVLQTLEKHPGLAEARAKRTAAFDQLTVAIGKGDNAGKQQAQTAYSQANQELRQKGNELPEVRALIVASENAGAAYLKKADEVYATQPETAAMFKEIIELRTKAAELRKASR